VRLKLQRRAVAPQRAKWLPCGWGISQQVLGLPQGGRTGCGRGLLLDRCGLRRRCIICIMRLHAIKLGVGVWSAALKSKCHAAPLGLRARDKVKEHKRDKEQVQA
jgi:hypothetical protein